MNILFSKDLEVNREEITEMGENVFLFLFIL